MRKRIARVPLVFLLISTLVWPPTPVLACAPMEEAVFTLRGGPDFPVHEYVQGKLGIPRPDYVRRYLFIAYRYYSGAPLKAEEQKALLAEWERPARDSDGSRPPGSVQPTNWMKAWSDARDKILGKPGDVQHRWGWWDPFGVLRWTERNNTTFGYYNCLPDGFRNAVERLNQHIQQFGEASAEVRDWATAQDQVFSNCGAEFAKPSPPIIPAETAATATAVLRADRSYQIAAAHFYAGQFDEARQRFETIAADASSPWRNIAPYLAARALLRKGSLNGGQGEYDAEALAQAKQLFQGVLDDPSRKDWHPAARRLLAYLEIRLHPRERLHELSQALTKPDAANVMQNLTDYTFLMDRLAGNWNTLRADDELTDWIVTVQNAGPQELAHAIAQWRRTGSAAWLVAALTRIEAPHAELEPLLFAAAQVRPESPAYAAVTFHRLRLLAENGKKDEARAELDVVFARQKDKLPISALNLFLALRMKLARNLEEFLVLAPRVPAGVSFDGTYHPIEWRESGLASRENASSELFDLDAATVLNRHLSLALLFRAAQDAKLAKPLRTEIAIAAWTRAAVLGDVSTGREAAGLVAQLAPETKVDLDAYVNAGEPQARKFAAAFAMLHFPGAQMDVHTGLGRWTPLGKLDNLRNNWWCALSDTQRRNPQAARKIPSFDALSWVYPEGEINSPVFLGAGEKGTAEEELERLSRAGAGPSFLGRGVVEWANKHPDDPRVPEALHLVVRASRYGCTDEEIGKYSKAAFELLHKRYPQSEWAKKTPYWFK